MRLIAFTATMLLLFYGGLALLGWAFATHWLAALEAFVACAAVYVAMVFFRALKRAYL